MIKNKNENNDTQPTCPNSLNKSSVSSDVFGVLRVSTVTGKSWLAACLFTYTGYYWLEYVFKALFSAIGPLMMMSLLCHSRVYSLIGDKFASLFILRNTDILQD